jgi:SOS response regulatory protein OraA/RecX
MTFASKTRRPRSPQPGEEQVQRSSARYPARTERSKPAPPAPGTARRYMVWLLSRREYAAVDLWKKAISKGHDVTEVEAALLTFQALGLQDDTRYAGMKARQCASRYGNRRVEQVLKTKKIDQDVVHQQIAELPDELQRATRLLESYAASDWDQTLQQKAWRRLATRGFSSGTIKEALSALKKQCLDAAADAED